MSSISAADWGKKITFVLAAYLIAGCSSTPHATTHHSMTSVATTSPASLTRAQRIAVLRSDTEIACQKVLAALHANKFDGIDRRDLTHTAHDLLVLGDDPESARNAEALVIAAFAEQDMDPKSPHYGTVSWKVAVHPPTDDANAIEFTCLPVGAILSRYSFRLSPSFLQQIKPHLAAALVAVRNHKVSLTYTNIFLMRITNLLIIGEAIGDADARQLGATYLNQWIDFTPKNGISEYNSPTYMETQLNCATIGYDCTRNAAVKAKFRSVLDLLWADACASYYPPAQQLGGAASRDYGFLYCDGPADRYFFLVGLRDERPVHTLLNDTSAPFCDAMESDYVPSDRTLALGRNLEKQFTCGTTWPDPWGDRTFYSTAAFSLGSAASSYDAQDRLVALRFGTGKRLPVISVSLDPHDNPDGTIKETGKDNHGKPTHWKMKCAIAQDRGAVLCVADISSNLASPVSSLGLNLTLPAHADGLWLDGLRIDPADMSEHPCNDKSIVIVREGTAAMAARLFDVGGFAGTTPAYVLKHDVDKGNAFRLVAYAYRGEQRTLNDHPVPAGFVINSETCPTDEAFAGFVEKSHALSDLSIQKGDNTWSATFGSIDVALNPSTGKPVRRTVNGIDVHRAGLEAVNGWDLATVLPPPPASAP